ncbi:MAG: helix-turn-helix transcriptional regulator [Taibaiella sp.]|jgi:transcriptional regulator with XRE-family HTH domain
MSGSSPLPKRLKEARLASGLSQKSLGIAAGIDEFSASPRMNQYETGKHIPDYSTLTKIAKVLKVPVAYFYAKDDVLAEIIKVAGLLTAEERKKTLKLLSV